MKYFIFVVSMLDSARRKQINNELQGEKFEFIDAVVGKNIDPKRLNFINDSVWVKERYNRSLTSGEIGCALSHRNIYQKMVDDDIEWAIIFEDDIYLKYDFFYEIEKIKKYFSHNDLFVLGVQEGLKSKDYILFSRKDKFNLDNGFSLRKTHHSEKYIYRTAAYIISKSSAKKILDFTAENFCCADDWYIFKKYNLINNIYLGDFVGHPEDISNQSLLEAERKKMEKKDWKQNFPIAYSFLRHMKILIRKTLYGAIK